jgi:hypothetical protein
MAYSNTRRPGCGQTDPPAMHLSIVWEVQSAGFIRTNAGVADLDVLGFPEVQRLTWADTSRDG